jgi:hypothetical protein
VLTENIGQPGGQPLVVRHAAIVAQEARRWGSLIR